MGVTTIVLVRGDYALGLEASPRTVVYALTKPPYSEMEESVRAWWLTVHLESDRLHEPRLDERALQVLAPVHASYPVHVRVAGGWASIVACGEK